MYVFLSIICVIYLYLYTDRENEYGRFAFVWFSDWTVNLAGCGAVRCGAARCGAVRWGAVRWGEQR